MSTSINVSVDRGGLLQRNRQQIIANRQSELDRSGTEEAVATAAEQREQRLAALGVTETGAPVGSSVAPRVAREQKPSAFRSGVPTLSCGPYVKETIRPETNPTLNQQQKYFVFDSFVKRNRLYVASDLIPKTVYLKSNDSYYDTPVRTEWATNFAANAGPGGSNAIYVTIFTPWAGDLDQELYSTCNGHTFFGHTPPTPEQNPENLPVQTITFSSLQSSALGYGSRPTYFITNNAWVPGCGIALRPRYFAGIWPSVELTAFQNWTSADESTAENQAALAAAWQLNSNKYTCEVFIKVEGDTANPVACQIGFGSVEFLIDKDAGGITIGTPEGSNFYPHLKNPRLMTTWTHLAVCSNGLFTRYFVNGIEQMLIPAGAVQSLQAGNIVFTPGTVNGVSYGTNKTLRFYMHGYRISKRCLYESNFTPPVNGIR